MRRIFPAPVLIFSALVFLALVAAEYCVTFGLLPLNPL